MEKSRKKAKRIKVCHKCGRKHTNDHKKGQTGFCVIRTEWGYFSEKDGEIHEFTLCEKCYDDYTRKFLVPVFLTEQTELL